MKFLFIAFFCILHYVSSHSWLACTDYMKKNGKNWNPRKCRGFPRDGYRFTRKNSFGADTIYDNQPAQSGNTCRTKFRRSSYRDGYPQAIYYPGQQVILVHPMKNHGADYCTNQYIPDHGSMIYRGRKNTDRDRPLNFYKKFKVANLGVSPFGFSVGKKYREYPKPGYQNAPNFCKNMDKAMGTYSFNVPKNIAPGNYTFVWVWSFSRPDHVYTTCFDVTIAPNKKERDSVLKSRGYGLYVPCGGKTSDLSPGSTVGCGNPTEDKLSTSLTSPRTISPRTTPSTPETKASTAPSGTPPSVRITSRKPTAAKILNRRKTKQTKNSEAELKVYQMSGMVKLPQPRKGTKQRTVKIQFGCPALAAFTNARLTKKVKRRSYVMVQRLRRNRNIPIYFRVTFPGSCPMKSRTFRAFVINER